MTSGSEVVARANTPIPGRGRLLVPALLVWAATAAAIGAGAGGGIMVLGGAGVGAALLAGGAVARARSRAAASEERLTGWLTPALVTAALLLLVGAQVSSGTAARVSPELTAAAEARTAVSEQLTLRGYPARSASGQVWVLAERAGRRNATPVLLWCGERTETPSAACEGPGWGPGAQVAVRGTVTVLEPGSSAAYGIRVVSVRTQPGFPSPGGVRERALQLRDGLRQRAASVWGGELVPGLAVGDTWLIDPAASEQFRDASLTHLVAVSGTHTTLLLTGVGALAARLGAGLRGRLAVQGITLAGFAIVVGPAASLERAAVMAVVVLVSQYGGKRAVGPAALGLAIVVLLARDPWQALQPGFALSVAATAGILVLAPPLRRMLRGRLRLPDALATPVAMAAAAQATCAPLLLLMQPGIPIVGVLANVLAAPAVPLGTGLGLAALVTLPMQPELGTVLLKTAALAGGWVSATAEVTAQLPGARWPWPAGWPGALLLLGSELLLGAGWWVRRYAATAGVRVPWGPPRTPARRATGLSAALTLGALGVLVGPTVIAPATLRATAPADWWVAACDVGQGDAILLRDPAAPQRVVLVDTGDDPRALTECLTRFGVRRIDTLVVSHDHQDHMGALLAVLDRTDRMLVAPENAEARAARRPRQSARSQPTAPAPAREVVESAEVAGVPVTIGDAAQRGSTDDGGVRWEVLSPPGSSTPATPNSASLIMRVRVGALTVLLLGDSGRDTQTALLRTGADVRADVVKVTHHGSRDQDPELLRRASATLGLISVGRENRYGHPTQEALASLQDAQTRVWRTDESGSIAVSGTPGALRVWTAG